MAVTAYRLRVLSRMSSGAMTRQAGKITHRRGPVKPEGRSGRVRGRDFRQARLSQTLLGTRASRPHKGVKHS